MTRARVLQLGLWATISASITIFLERRFWPMTLTFAGALAVTLYSPSLRPITGAVSSFAVTVNALAIWWRRGRQSAETTTCVRSAARSAARRERTSSSSRRSERRRPTVARSARDGFSPKSSAWVNNLPRCSA